MLLPLKIPAGIYRNGTEYQAKGRYFDADLIRFFEGTIRPLGGWRRVLGGTPRVELQVLGKARGIHTWRGNDGTRYLAVATEQKIYTFTERGLGLIDRTPVDFVQGFPDNVINTGYGGGIYGYEAYGTPRTPGNISDFATTASMDNFGDFLVCVSFEDGRLLYWDTLTATLLPVIAEAGITPINNVATIVTDERFVFCLGADGNKRLVRWSDQENLFNWEVTATTLAGDFELQTNGALMTAKRVRGQTLLLTTTDAHVANFIGPPFVYGFERVGTGCGIIGPNAAVVADRAVFWMGDQSFFMYDGFVKPVPSEVSDFVFSCLNKSQAQKVFAVYNDTFGEVTWYYPTAATNEVDSYVTYSVREGTWTIGNQVRTIGVDNNLYPAPIYFSPEGFMYEHEVGYDYEGQVPWLESGPIELGNGDQVYMSKYLYPDERTQGQVTASFSTQFYPNSPEYPHGPYNMANPTSVRFTGRQVAMRIQGEPMSDWRVGVPRLEVAVGGRR